MISFLFNIIHTDHIQYDDSIDISIYKLHSVFYMIHCSPNSLFHLSRKEKKRKKKKTHYCTFITCHNAIKKNYYYFHHLNKNFVS